MVAYNFMRQFAPAVASGLKRQTMRPESKRHARPGQLVQLYTGLRTRGSRLLGLGECEVSVPVTITDDAVLVPGESITDLDAFARADGFTDFPDMKAWFAEKHGLPFSGRLITWKPIKLPKETEDVHRAQPA